MKQVSGTVVLLICSTTNNMFVVQETRDGFTKKVWDFGVPTETREACEAPLATAYRAISEEVCVNAVTEINSLIYLGCERMTVDGSDGEPIEIITHFCTAFVSAEFNVSSLRPTDPEDVEQVGWWSLERLLQHPLRLDLEIDNRLKKYYQMATANCPHYVKGGV